MPNHSSTEDVKKDTTVQKAEQKQGREPQPQIYRFGPSVRRLLAEFDLDISSLKGTGPRGTLLKGDVLAAIKSGAGINKSSDASKLQKRATPPEVEKAPSSRTSVQPSLPVESSGLYEDIPNSQIRKAGFFLCTHLDQGLLLKN